MALHVNNLARHEGYWLVDVQVYEGVYRKEHYPVRVVDVPLAPPQWDLAQQEEQMQRFVLDQLYEHMRSGALSPKGAQIHGEQVWTWKREAVSS